HFLWKATINLHSVLLLICVLRWLVCKPMHTVLHRHHHLFFWLHSIALHQIDQRRLLIAYTLFAPIRIASQWMNFHSYSNTVVDFSQNIEWSKCHRILSGFYPHSAHL